MNGSKAYVKKMRANDSMKVPKIRKLKRKEKEDLKKQKEKIRLIKEQEERMLANKRMIEAEQRAMQEILAEEMNQARIEEEIRKQKAQNFMDELQAL